MGSHTIGKFRTRQHVIADLSANHVERLALETAFSVERIEKDYGFDLVIFTYGTNGALENGSFPVQLKATDSKTLRCAQDIWPLRLSASDLSVWLKEPYPVILVYYHAKRGCARWLYIQRDLKGLKMKKGQQSKTVHLPRVQALDKSAMQSFRAYKERAVAQASTVITHD